MIGEHLKGDDTQQGCQEIQRLGHLDNPVGNGANLLVALGDHGNDAAATGLDFLHIGDYLLILEGEDIEKYDALLSLAETGGDYNWI